MSRIKVREVIIVEGKYDKIALEPLVDAIIITTDGFGIFKDKEKQKLIRRLADERGLIILTDSDGAGLVIRNFINGCVESSKVKHAYIPQLIGKEKRKSAPSKEGTLGVEGMEKEVLSAALKRAGAYVGESAEKQELITKARFYEDGYIGRDNSAEKRKALLKRLELPLYLSTNSLLKIINLVCDIEEYEKITEELFGFGCK